MRQFTDVWQAFQDTLKELSGEEYQQREGKHQPRKSCGSCALTERLRERDHRDRHRIEVAANTEQERVGRALLRTL